MKKHVLFAISGLVLLAGCQTDDTSGPQATENAVGAEQQERTCAEAFAGMNTIDMNSVRVNGRDTAPSGNTIVFLQADNLSAACEITDGGRVVQLNDTSN